MMHRKLKGSLENLGLAALFRLLGATGASGRLDVETPEGSFSMEIGAGRVARPEVSVMEAICGSLDQSTGSFSFTAEEHQVSPEEGVPLSSLLDLCREEPEPGRKQFASDLDVDNLLAGELPAEVGMGGSTRIHLLPHAAPEHPLEDLLNELEEAAPEELLFAQVGVVTTDPRPWRGWLEQEWRRRGWELKAFGVPDVPLEELDGLVIHHRLSVTRVGHEDDWLELLRSATTGERFIPVLWVGPLGDPVWVARLVEAGVSFLLPAPAGEGGETWQRFRETVTRVMARLLQSGGRGKGEEGRLVPAELVEALVRGSNPGEKIGVLLQIASGALRNGAIFTVEETSIRCRAGFGFPLSKEITGLPRGIAVLERVIRGEESLGRVDPDATGARQLARVLGVDRLPEGMVVIPLAGRGGTVGVLVGDRKPGLEGDMEELVLMARRVGGVLLDS